MVRLVESAVAVPVVAAAVVRSEQLYETITVYIFVTAVTLLHAPDEYFWNCVPAHRTSISPDSFFMTPCAFIVADPASHKIVVHTRAWGQVSVKSIFVQAINFHLDNCKGSFIESIPAFKRNIAGSCSERIGENFIICFAIYHLVWHLPKLAHSLPPHFPEFVCSIQKVQTPGCIYEALEEAREYLHLLRVM